MQNQTNDLAHRQNGAKNALETPQESAAPLCSVQRSCSPVDCMESVGSEGLGGRILKIVKFVGSMLLTVLLWIFSRGSGAVGIPGVIGPSPNLQKHY